jgi:catechol 2,3-dioxygenase-like lactoylglutathione lyase family enzyme
MEIPGIHHVTAICGSPQTNIDFYTSVLGIRLVKLTVNFDDPQSYHLYYGDAMGRPGTILTFFAWPGAPRGWRGTGQVTTVSFSVPPNSLDYWRKRLTSKGVKIETESSRFDDKAIAFYDPDGLLLELVANPKDDREGWKEGSVPSESAVKGFYGVTLSEEGYEQTSSLITDVMGFHFVGQEGNRFRYRSSAIETPSIVDILCLPGAKWGQVSLGTVHHVAWRTPNDEEQRAWREKLAKARLNVTPVIDRKYFHSIYYREPGHVLFEIATDPPGFTVDETLEKLGSALVLPAWLEPMRSRLESILPPVKVPEARTTN